MIFLFWRLSLFQDEQGKVEVALKPLNFADHALPPGKGQSRPRKPCKHPPEQAHGFPARCGRVGSRSRRRRGHGLDNHV